MYIATFRSSVISGYAYNAEALTLDIRFHGGSVYRYFYVPAPVFLGFEQARSKGAYYNVRIKGQFASEQIV
jgi:hypothetical protein